MKFKCVRCGDKFKTIAQAVKHAESVSENGVLLTAIGITPELTVEVKQAPAKRSHKVKEKS